jgi:hypothetical protein
VSGTSVCGSLGGRSSCTTFGGTRWPMMGLRQRRPIRGLCAHDASLAPLGEGVGP